MAVSLEDGNKVWQKVNKALAGANPGVVAAFRGLKEYIGQQGGNPQLQFIPFSEAQCDVSGGTALLDGACKLYGVYTKKEDSATDNWFWLYDDATNDGTAADAMLCVPQLVANAEAAAVFPAGFALGTGIVVTQYATDPLGASDGSNGAAGFVVIGGA